MYSDSIDKIVKVYFRAVTAEHFAYKGRIYPPTPLKFNKNLLQSYTYPERCAGCCNISFTLDYLPTEDTVIRTFPRDVQVNGNFIPIRTRYPHAYATRCEYITPELGRCEIHGFHPFTCDFELIRFSIGEKRSVNHVSTRLFGRGWNMLTVTGERGAKCKIGPVTIRSIKDVRRKFLRLEEWAQHFKIKTKISKIVKWIDEGDYRKTMVI